MIAFKHLKLIEVIDRKGSLSKAAKELNLSQSALSHQLKQLEEILEIKVFHRVNNNLIFTEEGKEFRDYGASILKEMAQLKTRMAEIKEFQVNQYTHGYSLQETNRLYDQASTVADFIHWDSYWEKGTKILEAGCGVGAQTQIIATNNPTCEITAVDISDRSITEAKKLIATSDIKNVQFQIADLRKLNFPDEYYDHIFVCFVLEHTPNPLQILTELKRVLKKDGTITVVEGDHGSTYFYPDSTTARKAVAAQVELQKKNGGNANIGRTLYPLLEQCGFQQIAISPRQIYVDKSKPNLVDGFIRKTFTAMIKGVEEEAVSKGIISKNEMEEGIANLYRVADTGGTFCYTFFKGVGVK